MVPFFVAGFGMVGAGLFFDHVVVRYRPDKITHLE
jgi:hypothetical protein